MTHERGGVPPEGMENQEGLVGLTKEEQEHLRSQYELSQKGLAELKAKYKRVQEAIAGLEQSIAEKQRGQFDGPLRTGEESHIELLYEDQKAGLEAERQELATKIAELEQSAVEIQGKLAA